MLVHAQEERSSLGLLPIDGGSGAAQPEGKNGGRYGKSGFSLNAVHRFDVSLLSTTCRTAAEREGLSLTGCSHPQLEDADLSGDFKTLARSVPIVDNSIRAARVSKRKRGPAGPRSDSSAEPDFLEVHAAHAAHAAAGIGRCRGFLLRHARRPSLRW